MEILESLDPAQNPTDPPPEILSDLMLPVSRFWASLIKPAKHVI